MSSYCVDSHSLATPSSPGNEVPILTALAASGGGWASGMLTASWPCSGSPPPFCSDIFLPDGHYFCSLQLSRSQRPLWDTSLDRAGGDNRGWKASSRGTPDKRWVSGPAPSVRKEGKQGQGWGHLACRKVVAMTVVLFPLLQDLLKATCPSSMTPRPLCWSCVSLVLMWHLTGVFTCDNPRDIGGWHDVFKFESFWT